MQVGPAPQSSATPTPPEGTARPGAGHAGLSDAEAAARLRRDGPNLLPEAEGRHWARLLADVLREPMLLLLVAAASVYLLLGDPFEAVALFASVLLVAGLSFYQQQRAEGALRALRELSSPRAQVLREGGWRRVPASELVLGDTIDLREGDRVPADARLERGPGVTLDESLLTGESAPVRRAGSDPDPEVRRVLASTLVVGGQSEACVTATGTRTEVGRIGQALRTARWHPTPTQREMRRAIVVFSFVGIASCVLVVWLYAAAHGDWLRALLAGITLAISNIPEEFPLVMTVFLALGAWRLAQARTLVRRPPAIETLGSITVLCTDKTGTLTANRMRVVELVADGRRVPASDALEGTAREVLRQADLACPALTHDPMERAIRALAATRGEAAAATAPVRVYPLSNELLAYAQVWALPDGGLHVACKGAPEAIAALCGRAGAEADAVLGEAGTLAREGKRLLGVASCRWPGDAASLPADLRGFRFAWLGLVAFADPLRPGVPAAVAEAREAGIRVVMLTGDHPDTARAIALEAGLERCARVVTGSALGDADDAALAATAGEADVFARVRPEHKLRLVEALKRTGAVVAMTGDGVNDAPALMAADVGIAMGQRGTDVAREAAGIVLLDDDFVTIVKAVRLGRAIYDNLRRAVRFILAVHVPITGMALLPLLLGAPMVLLPLHVVLLELIVDPASSIVLEQEPPHARIMRRPPRAPTAHLLDFPTLLAGLGQGAAVFAAVAATYLAGRQMQLTDGELAALAFIALVAGNVGLVAFNRTPASTAPRAARSHVAFAVLAAAAAIMLLLATGVPRIASWFGFAPVDARLALASALAPLLVLFVLACLRRRSNPDATPLPVAESHAS